MLDLGRSLEERVSTKLSVPGESHGENSRLQSMGCDKVCEGLTALLMSKHIYVLSSFAGFYFRKNSCLKIVQTAKLIYITFF